MIFIQSSTAQAMEFRTRIFSREYRLMDDMHQKVIDHYKGMENREQPCRAVRMAELVPGVIAVLDDWDEVDALFDLTRWRFTVPKIWEPSPGDSGNPCLAEKGLGVLPGLGTLPPVKTIEAMVDFAKRNLTPIGGVHWHDAPQYFKP